MFTNVFDVGSNITWKMKTVTLELVNATWCFFCLTLLFISILAMIQGKEGGSTWVLVTHRLGENGHYLTYMRYIRRSFGKYWPEIAKRNEWIRVKFGYIFQDRSLLREVDHQKCSLVSRNLNENRNKNIWSWRDVNSIVLRLWHCCPSDRYKTQGRPWLRLWGTPWPTGVQGQQWNK